MNNNEYHTMQKYSQPEKGKLSPSMEDYLEMIYRQVGEAGYLRVNRLAALLNVTPPSSSKMVVKLKENGLVEYEPYGIIELTDEGRVLGRYLLRRHQILHRFFCQINGTDNELELVERIEHSFDRRTIENIEKWLEAGGIVD